MKKLWAFLVAFSVSCSIINTPIDTSNIEYKFKVLAGDNFCEYYITYKYKNYFEKTIRTKTDLNHKISLKENQRLYFNIYGGFPPFLYPNTKCHAAIIITVNNNIVVNKTITEHYTNFEYVTELD